MAVSPVNLRAVVALALLVLTAAARPDHEMSSKLAEWPANREFLDTETTWLSSAGEESVLKLKSEEEKDDTKLMTKYEEATAPGPAVSGGDKRDAGWMVMAATLCWVGAIVA